MIKKSAFIFLLLLYHASMASVIQCPRIDDIKNGHFYGWLPEYKNNEELASAKDVDNFKQHVRQFTVARWGKAYLENGHCFYQGTDPIVDTIVFAQDAWRPTDDAHWTWVEPQTLAECYSTNEQDCGFKQ